jgi:PAS domain S-box-containing protein
MNDVVSGIANATVSVGFEPKSQSTKGQRLLVVDDEAVVCQIVQGFLGVDGWEVDSAQTIQDAELRAVQHPYPVILCDVHLPGGSSHFVQKLKSRNPSPQIIMFTGDPTVDTVRDALQYGAYDYLIKPCRRDELAHVVQRAFERYTLLREQERLQAENESYRHRLENMVEKRTDQLRESELRYQAIFNRAVDAILLVDLSSGLICEHNFAAARLLNARDTSVVGKSACDILGDELIEVLREAKSDGHREWRFQRLTFAGSNGLQRVGQVTIGKVELGDQSCLQIVVRDITDHLELLERNELMESELLSEQRLAAIGLLASGIAHNINTPLMGIYGTAQLIKMKHPGLEDIDGVITQVERINQIIRNLMWKSRQEQDVRFQELDLNQLLGEELKFLEADLEFKHNVEKHFSLSDAVPTIMGRYSDFSQSIMNIVRNALDAMYNCMTKILHVSTDVVDGDIRIIVRDSGCGIREADCDKIFLPFFTTKPLVGRAESDEPTGTGLGLSTVQKLLTPYGARFEVNSTVGAGTTMTVYLPIAQNTPGNGAQTGAGIA